MPRKGRIRLLGKLFARLQEEREEELRELARQLHREQWLAGQDVKLGASDVDTRADGAGQDD